MKKIYLALMCMASFALMTACGGDKKADNKAESNGTENTENVENNEADEQNDTDGQEQDEQQVELWGVPAQTPVFDCEALYASGDFKPFDGVIFEDDLSAETAGELRSKWDITSGGAEVGAAEGYNYISMLGGDTELKPMVDGSATGYLPAKYAVEFEYMYGQDVWFNIFFKNEDDEIVGSIDMWLAQSNWNFAKTDDEWISGNSGDIVGLVHRTGWNHFAATYDNGNLKLFINGKRIGNMPNIKQAAALVIRGGSANGQSHYVRNIRITK